MATREETIAGLELTVSQAKRTTSLFAEGEWESKRACGWTPKEVYSHLASVAALVPSFAQGLMRAPEDKDIAEGMDIDDMNAQAVASMASMSPEQVMAAFEGNYEKLIDFVKSLPDDQLKVVQSPVHNLVASHRNKLDIATRHPGKDQQFSDQVLHAGGPINDIRQKTFSFFVKAPLVLFFSSSVKLRILRSGSCRSWEAT